MRLLVVLVVALLGSADARAQLPDVEARARAHFEIGRGHYSLGDYRKAIDEWGAGYALVHKARFLLNLAQAYRQLHELGRARELCARFLAEAPSVDPERPGATALVAELDSEMAAHPSERAAPEPPRELPANALPTAGVAISFDRAPAPSARESHRRWPWVVAGAGAAVVVAVVVVLAFALSAHDVGADLRRSCASDPGCALVSVK